MSGCELLTYCSLTDRSTQEQVDGHTDKGEERGGSGGVAGRGKRGVGGGGGLQTDEVETKK